MMKISEETLDALIGLQNIEKKAIKAKGVLSVVESKIKKLDDSYATILQELEEKEKECNEINKEYDEIKYTSDINDERIKKSSEDIKKVQTNKEYQTLLREIDENKKKQIYFEEELIKLLEAKEANEKIIETLKTDSTQLKEKAEQEKKEIKSNSVKEEKELQKVLKKREKMSKSLDEGLLKKFNLISKQQRGIAVVPVKDATCEGCYMKIPPQMYIELQKDSIVSFCPFCHKMIYYLKEKSK